MSNESVNLELPVEHVSDTAWLVADMRRMETERPDAHFRDILATKLLGKKGAEIRERMPSSMGFEFIMAIRTKVIDEVILDLIAAGVDTVINLAAGLDTRPYRLNLPQNLHWIEVDYGPVMAYKNQTLADEKPTCHLERISVDLADDQSRQQLLKDLGARCRKALVLTEGLLYYLKEQNVASLARELHDQDSFKYWMMDITDPEMLQWFANKMEQPKAPVAKTTSLRFAPPDMGIYLGNFGWKKQAFHSFRTEGERLNRLPIAEWPEEARSTLAKSGIILFEHG